ncbi:MAG: hypothetical protein AAFP04_06685 [Myxococcota bacterium]
MSRQTLELPRIANAPTSEPPGHDGLDEAIGKLVERDDLPAAVKKAISTPGFRDGCVDRLAMVSELPNRDPEENVARRIAHVATLELLGSGENPATLAWDQSSFFKALSPGPKLLLLAPSGCASELGHMVSALDGARSSLGHVGKIVVSPMTSAPEGFVTMREVVNAISGGSKQLKPHDGPGVAALTVSPDGDVQFHGFVGHHDYCGQDAAGVQRMIEPLLKKVG